MSDPWLARKVQGESVEELDSLIQDSRDGKSLRLSAQSSLIPLKHTKFPSPTKSTRHKMSTSMIQLLQFHHQMSLHNSLSLSSHTSARHLTHFYLENHLKNKVCMLMIQSNLLWPLSGLRYNISSVLLAFVPPPSPQVFMAF